MPTIDENLAEFEEMVLYIRSQIKKLKKSLSRINKKELKWVFTQGFSHLDSFDRESMANRLLNEFNPEKLESAQISLIDLSRIVRLTREGEVDTETLTKLLEGDAKQLKSQDFFGGYGEIASMGLGAQRILNDFKDQISQNLSKTLKETLHLYFMVLGSFERTVKLLQKTGGGEEEIVTLYHATTTLKQLLSKGFQKKAPSAAGMGGDPLEVSFTYSLREAQSLANQFRFHQRLSIGKFNGLELVTLIKNLKSNIKKILLRNLVEEDFMKQGLFGEMCETGLPAPEKSLPKAQFGRGSCLKSVKDIQKVRDKGNLVLLLHHYLRALKESGEADYMGLSPRTFEQWKRVQLNNIGIIAAKVNISGNGVKYIGKYKEFAVPPSAIVKVLGEIKI